MKNEYIRRGMLAGNSEIPIDLVPSLPGTVLFNSNLECELLLGNEQSAHMIIRTELGDDLVTFTQNDASHIKSRISVPTIQINNNIVPKYKAEISQSVLVIQSPYTKTLEIIPVVNETVSNAAKAFGFFVSPDPRAISRVGEISSSPGIGQTSQHNLATYITRFEDKTSESINRAIDSVAKNVEDLHLRTKEYEAHTSDLTLVKLSGSIQTALDTVGSKPIAFYVDESGRAKTFISNQMSLTTPFKVDPSLEFSTFKDAYNLQNIQTFNRKTALQFDLQIQESGNNVFANTRNDAINTKTSNKVEKFGVNPVFMNQVSLHRVTDTLSNLNNGLSLASDGQTITPGFIETAGVFHKGKHINTGNFTVLDSNTIKLAQPLSIDIVKFAQADGLIALISDEFSYGFKITHVILNDTLIIEPLRDIEMRVGARIIGESYPQNLPIGLSGTYFIHIGDKAPRSFFSACHLISGQSIAVPSIPPYSVLVANINENCLTQANRRSDHDTRLNLRTVNSANTLDIADSLSSALSGNLSNRNAQSKLFTYPYIERLLHTNTDYSYGNNVYSSLIKAISSRNNILAHNVISMSSISPTSVYNAVDFGVFSSDLQQIMTVLITLLFPANVRSNTYVRPNGESTTIGTLIDEIDYTSSASNPVVYMVLLIIVDFIPRLSQAFGLVAEYDGYLRSQTSQPFSRYDIGKDFVLNKQNGASFLARMVEFVSPNVSRFIELRSGLNIQEGEYTSVVGLRGCPWSQSYDLSLSENVDGTSTTIDTIKLNTHNLDLDQGIVLPNAKILQAGTSVIIHTGVQIDGMDASALNLIRILPDFLLFSVPSPVSQALADRLYPSFLRQADSPVFAPSNSYYSKSCLYLEASSNSYNLSGYYEIDEAFPIISNNRAYIGFKVGELVGKSLYQKSRPSSLAVYAPNNVINKVVNKYEFDITDPEIQSVSPIFCRAHEVTQDKNYQSIKGDIKIDDLSINIVDDGHPTISESKISIYSSIKNNAVSVLIPDTPVGSEQLPQPFLKINDLSNEQALITFSGNDVLTNQEYLRKRTNSSTVAINKSNTTDSPAIAVTRGDDYSADPALISVRDTTRTSQTSSDDFGRENTLALSSVGNVSVSGLFRVESDVRDTSRAITNYKGTGVNLIGGVDSHINPTTSAHSALKDAIYTANTNHFEYNDNAVKPYAQYPKYLGEAHVISKKSGLIQYIGNDYVGETQYHDLGIIFNTSPNPADIGRAVILTYTDNSSTLGHVISISGNAAACRFISANIRFSDIRDASMLGREWNANFGTVKVSDKIDILEKGSNDVIGSIYAENGEVKIPGFKEVQSDIQEFFIVEDQFIQGLVAPPISSYDYFLSTMGAGYNYEGSDSSGLKTQFLRFVPEPSVQVDGGLIVVKSKNPITSVGAHGTLFKVRHYDLRNTDQADPYYGSTSWEENSWSDIIRIEDFLEYDELEYSSAEFPLTYPVEPNEYFTIQDWDYIQLRPSELSYSDLLFEGDTTNNRTMELHYDCISRVFKDDTSMYMILSLEGKLIRINIPSYNTALSSSINESYYTYICYTATLRLDTKVKKDVYNFFGSFPLNDAVNTWCATSLTEIDLHRPTRSNLGFMLKRALRCCTEVRHTNTDPLYIKQGAPSVALTYYGTHPNAVNKLYNLTYTDQRLKNAVNIAKDCIGVVIHGGLDKISIRKPDFCYAIPYGWGQHQYSQHVFAIGAPRVMYESPYDDSELLTSPLGSKGAAQLIGNADKFFTGSNTYSENVSLAQVVSDFLTVKSAYSSLTQVVIEPSTPSIFGDDLDIDCLVLSPLSVINKFMLETLGIRTTTPGLVVSMTVYGHIKKMS